nr:Ty3/gypsy retrotransposon protein [Tanacetum cinerariifolium]
GIPEEVMEGTFIKGLRPELQSAVRVMQPEGLNHAMKLAIMIDDNKLNGVIGKSAPKPSTWGYNAGRIYNESVSTRWSVNNSERKPASATTGRLNPFKRLTNAEMAEKRSKRICFRCDEKFAPGHTCASKTLQVLLVGDEEEDEDSEPEHVHLDSIDVSLNSVIGFTTPRTMKIQGILGDRDVVLTLLELQVVDMTLGYMTVNWKELRMTFVKDGRNVTVKGEIGLSRTLVSLKFMVRSLQKEKKGFLVEMKQLDDTQAEATTIETSFDIAGLLAEYEYVFNLPSSLPPSRDHEHSIMLKDGTTPISVRPYCYPHIQKNEIKKLVKEILAAGVIQPSSSPYSCLDLLVKKKDG